MVRRAAVATLITLCAQSVQSAQGQTCTPTATSVAFGSYVSLMSGTDASTGTITVTCSTTGVSILFSYTIALSIGGGGAFATRSMSGPLQRLSYQLYRDSGDTQIWGDGTASTYTVTDGYLLGINAQTSRNYTVYGIIPSQVAKVGSYLDTITVTLTY